MRQYWVAWDSQPQMAKSDPAVLRQGLWNFETLCKSKYGEHIATHLSAMDFLFVAWEWWNECIYFNARGSLKNFLASFYLLKYLWI